MKSKEGRQKLEEEFNEEYNSEFDDIDLDPVDVSLECFRALLEIYSVLETCCFNSIEYIQKIGQRKEIKIVMFFIFKKFMIFRRDLYIKLKNKENFLSLDDWDLVIVDKKFENFLHKVLIENKEFEKDFEKLFGFAKKALKKNFNQKVIFN